MVEVVVAAAVEVVVAAVVEVVAAAAPAAPPATATLVPIMSSALSRASDSKIVSSCCAHLKQQREMKQGAGS